MYILKSKPLFTDWDKTLAKNTFDRKLLSQMYEELLYLNNKKQRTHFKKRAKTLTGTSLKKIHGWQICIWKNVPHHTSSGKCTLKQWYHGNLLTWPESKQWWNQTLLRTWGNRTLPHCWWECKMVHSLWKTMWQFLIELKVPLPHHLLKEVENHIHTKTCMWTLTAALFIIAKSWKQPRCPSEGECINGL